jgi:hypothetical protein
MATIKVWAGKWKFWTLGMDIDVVNDLVHINNEKNNQKQRF